VHRLLKSLLFIYTKRKIVLLLGFTEPDHGSLILQLLLHNTHAIVETWTALCEFTATATCISCTGFVTITVAFTLTAKIFCHVTCLSIELKVPGFVVSSKAQVGQMHRTLDVPIAIHPRHDLFWHTVFSNVYD
jgi:hypothetical protein